MLDDAENVLKKFKEAESIHEEWMKKVKTAQEEHVFVKEDLQKLRREDGSLVEAAQAKGQFVQQEKHELQTLNQKEKSMSFKLEKLSRKSVDMSVEEADQDSSGENDAGEMEVETEEDAEHLESHQL